MCDRLLRRVSDGGPGGVRTQRSPTAKRFRPEEQRFAQKAVLVASGYILPFKSNGEVKEEPPNNQTLRLPSPKSPVAGRGLRQSSRTSLLPALAPGVVAPK